MNIISLIGNAISGLFLGVLLTLIIVSVILALINLLFSRSTHTLFSIAALFILTIIIGYHSIACCVLISLKGCVNDVMEMGRSAMTMDSSISETFNSIVDNLSPENAQQLQASTLKSNGSESQFNAICSGIKHIFNIKIWWEIIKITFYSIVAVILGGVLCKKIVSSRGSSSRPVSRTVVRPRGSRVRR